jgi:plasmid stabilization system protein ParE
MAPADDALKANPSRAISSSNVRATLAAEHKKAAKKTLTSYTVIFTPESEAQLTELYRYIAAASSPEVAARYTDLLREPGVPSASRHPKGRYPPWSRNNQLPKTRCDRVQSGC